jgi:hypothetical protein
VLALRRQTVVHLDARYEGDVVEVGLNPGCLFDSVEVMPHGQSVPRSRGR